MKEKINKAAGLSIGWLIGFVIIGAFSHEPVKPLIADWIIFTIGVCMATFQD